MDASHSSQLLINAEAGRAKPLSLVQQRARQFEALATQRSGKSQECNWWLKSSKKEQENTCDCEPCESSNQKYIQVNTKEHTEENTEEVEEDTEEVEENTEEVEENITQECEEGDFSNEKNEDVDCDTLNENHAIDDDEFQNDIGNITYHSKGVVEAINSNLDVTINSNEDTVNFTDHEYDSFTDDEEDEESDYDENAVKSEVNDVEAITETKLANVVQELIENEKTYIDKLTTGIENYVQALTIGRLPRTLRGQMYNIFGNIIQIRDFHEQRFYPSLLACNGDIVELSDTFSNYIQNGYFYSYVLYAMNKKRSEKVREIPVNKTFFSDRQNEIGDKLGVNSFLMEPIQRLPKYRLLIDQLAKVLTPFLEVEKTRLAACSRAEKNVQRLLNTVNESISLNDIIDCNEINLFHQGKFLRQNEFDIHDQEVRRRFRGKVFLFEKSVVYAEKSDDKVLLYRGCYPKDVTGIREYDDGRKFDLYIGKCGHRQIELTTSEFGLIQTWVNLVKDMLVKSIEQEKRKIAKKMHEIRSRNSLRPTDVIVRKSGANYGSSSGSGSSWTGSSSSSGFSSKSASLGSSAYASGISNISNISGYSTGSADSDLPRTTWYTNIEEIDRENDSNDGKTTEKLLRYEKHYIHLISQFVKIDMEELSDDIKFQIKTFSKTIVEILRLHREQIYPDLKNCHQNIVQICNVFRLLLQYNALQVYETYTAFVPKAYQIIYKHTSNKSFKDSMNLPVKQISYYGSMLSKMMVELKESDEQKFGNIRNELKELALTDMEYSKFEKRCQANYNLNQLDPGIAEQYGLVFLTEKVSISNVEHTLLILQRGIVCVRSRQSLKTQLDKYTKRIFLIDRKCISYSADKYRTAIKFYDICSRDMKYKVTFSSVERKTKIIIEVNKIRSNF